MSSADNPEHMQEALLCLRDLVVDENTDVRAKNCRLLQSRGAYDMLCSLELSDKPQEVLNEVEELARLIALAQ